MNAKNRPNPITADRTVKGMKETLKIFVSSVHMLLSLEKLDWPQQDYAIYISLQELSGKVLKSNPTRQQILMVLVTWGRFCKSVSERVPVEDLRMAALSLYEQAAMPYEKWLKEEENAK